MDSLKSAAGMTASLEDFQDFPRSSDRLPDAHAGSRRRFLIIAGLLLLALAVSGAAALGWLTAPAKPAPLPLTGSWNCSLGSEPIGTLSVDGWNYVLGSNSGGESEAGTFERVVYGKYREEFLRVQGGALNEQFGINLGYHYHMAGKPEALVFSVGPGSGIRCSRM